MKVNPTSLSVNQLLGTANEQYVIPPYQRRYSWRDRQVGELLDDIKLVEKIDTHLLGSIVCLSEAHTADLNRLELVDGQQRLTTISIVLECIRQRFERDDLKDDAADIRRLLVAKTIRGSSVRKIALDSIDATDFESLLENDPSADIRNEELRTAFRMVRDWVNGTNLDDLRAFVYRLVNQAIVIRLDVSEAKDAFKLFETINNRGLSLNPTDIIKNFLLGNAARFGPEELKLGRQRWAELLRHLDGTSTDAFFRYFLMSVLRARLTAGQVVASFKKLFMYRVKEATKLPDRHLYWDPGDEEDDGEAGVAVPEGSETNSSGKQSLKEFLSFLTENAKVYGQLVLAKTESKRINRRLRALRMIKAVQTFGFLMHLRVGGCDDKEFRKILKLTEAFVLRRHVCRERANETEALFARLCSADARNPFERTRQEYRDLCPSDEKFRTELTAAGFPSNLIDRARYCLERIELSKHGDHDELGVLEAEDVHVEHIIPQKIGTKKSKEEFGDWIEYLGPDAEARHSKYVDRIGNMTLFAGDLNIGASNNPFGRKKPDYKKSALLLTKELSDYEAFKFEDVEKRSKELAELAVQLWPMP